MLPKSITDLQEVILATHGCRATYNRVHHIRETLPWDTTWDGMVVVFRLVNHPTAKRCYAWTYRQRQETKYTTVLELPPVDSAASAVKFAIAN